MWHINNIHAKNVASFKELSFEPTSGVATLVFGNNKDNSENQPSNGSGKSALIEVFALAITGDPLRKVKVDEIIRDDANEMGVSMELWNDETKDVLIIDRQFSRKNPQKITVTINGDEQVQPSVIDYNRYILDMIGITRDEFHSYYVLTETHYQSFFSSSDKDKKAIINKFSNADLIDESIRQIEEDLEPVNEKMGEWQLSIERLNGAIEVLEKQINYSKSQEAESAKSKESRKAELSEMIANKRSQIRTAKEAILSLQQSIDKMVSAERAVASLESSEDTSFNFIYDEIINALTDAGIYSSDKFSNWPSKISDIYEKMGKFDEKIAEDEKKLEVLLNRIESGKEYVERATLNVGEQQKNLDTFMSEYEANMEEARSIRDKAETLLRDYQERLANLRKSISSLKNSIAGTIECPNCKHRFVLGNTVDVEKTERTISEYEEMYQSLYEQNKDNDWYAEYNEMVASISSSKKSIEDKFEEANNELLTYKRGLNTLLNDESVISGSINSHKALIANLQQQLTDISNKMFSQAYSIIDDSIDNLERMVKKNNLEIGSYEGAISTYEKQIEELDSQKESFTIESLLKNLSQKKTERYASQIEFDKYKEKYLSLSEQGKRFVRFKGALANTKINALSQMLNGILEEIGSDLRVRIDGFKTLKNGTVRDKISVSILKDGVDFGSASKLSKGERTRIDTACIVAMSKLVNSKCDNEKGLDLLIMDEILSGVDEKGLLGIYDALNKLKVTTIVVSHNPVAQSYPYTLTVTKEHGISTI